MKKMIKRAVALTLSLMLLVTGVFVNAADVEADSDFVKMSTLEFDALKSMGLLTDDFLTMSANSGVSRAQFIGGLHKMAGLPEGSAALGHPFTDVNENTPYKDAISYFYNAGFINGTSKTAFSPNEGITYSQALKVMVDLLGYKQFTEQIMGPYPTGYLNTATKLELMDGLQIKSFDDLISAEAAVVLLYNYGMAYLADDVTYSSNGEVFYATSSSRYPLSAYHKIYSGRAVVQDNGLVSLNGGKPDGETVTIGNTRFETNGANYHEYLGCKVKYFYRVEEPKPVLLWLALDSDNSILTLDAKELAPTDSRYGFDKIVYYKGNDNEPTTVDIDTYANFVYNNAFTNQGLTLDHIKIDAGEMRLIDNDGDHDYDLVIIEEFKNYFVTTVSAEKKNIMCKYGQVINLNLYNKVFCFKDGESIEVDAIPNNVVLSCVESANREYIYIYVNGAGSQEALKSTSQKNGKTYYTFENGTYVFSHDLEEAIGAGVYDIPAIKPGTTYKYYLDKAGDIGAIQSVDIGSMQYAVFMDMAEYDKDFSAQKGVMLQLFTSDSVMAVAEVADKVIIDGVGGQSDRALLGYASHKGEVVKVAFNANGKIREIDFAEDLGGKIIDKTRFTLDFKAVNEAYHRDSVFESRFSVSASTVMFVKYNRSDGEVEWVVGRLDELKSGETYPGLQVYDCNEFREPAAIKLEVDAGDNGSRTGYILVDEVIQTMNNDGEIEYQLTGLNQGRTLTFKIGENAVLNGYRSLNEVKRGDIIRVFQLRNQVFELDKIFSLADPHEVTDIEDTTPTASNGGGGHIAYGYLYSQSSTSLILYKPNGWKSGDKLLVSRNVTDKINNKLSVYDAKNDKVYVGEVDDLYQNAVPNADGTLTVNSESTRVFLYRSNTLIAEMIAVYY